MPHTRRMPNYLSIPSMLKKYGDALFTPCPSSERLMRYAEDAALLSNTELKAIEKGCRFHFT